MSQVIESLFEGYDLDTSTVSMDVELHACHPDDDVNLCVADDDYYLYFDDSPARL